MLVPYDDDDDDDDYDDDDDDDDGDGYMETFTNKANLRDLIAATGRVILFKLDSNHRFVACVTLKFDGWPRKITRHVLYTTSSFVCHFRSISEL